MSNYSDNDEIDSLIIQVAIHLGRENNASAWIEKIKQEFYDTIGSLKQITREEWNGSIALPGRIFDEMKRFLCEEHQGQTEPKQIKELQENTAESEEEDDIVDTDDDGDDNYDTDEYNKEREEKLRNSEDSNEEYTVDKKEDEQKRSSVDDDKRKDKENNGSESKNLSNDKSLELTSKSHDTTNSETSQPLKKRQVPQKPLPPRPQGRSTVDKEREIKEREINLVRSSSPVSRSNREAVLLTQPLSDYLDNNSNSISKAKQSSKNNNNNNNNNSNSNSNNLLKEASKKSFIAEGFLLKRTKNSKHFNRRYVIVRKGIFYYSKKQKSTLKDGIDLLLFSVRTIDQPNSFELVGMDRTYVFQCESEDDALNWVAAISSQIKSIRSKVIRQSMKQLPIKKNEVKTSPYERPDKAQNLKMKAKNNSLLKKRGWVTRYCLLKHEYLYYFKSSNPEDMKEPMGEINIVFGFPKMKESHKRFKFEIVTADKTYEFSCETQHDLEEWVSTLQNANQSLMNVILRNTIEERRISILNVLKNDFSEMENIAKKSRDKLKEILFRDENLFCVDCGAKDPRWASINLGVFICIECSGIHRNMGSHISKVRSVTLDEWDEEVIDFVGSIGNKKANEIWEAKLPPERKITPNSTMNERRDFIRAKYEKKEFYAEPNRVQSLSATCPSSIFTSDNNQS